MSISMRGQKFILVISGILSVVKLLQALFLGVVLLGFSWMFAPGISITGSNPAFSASVIGGADGPTSVFLAGKIGISSLWIVPFVFLLVELILYLFVFVKAILAVKKKRTVEK